jgi:hypothetical protein
VTSGTEPGDIAIAAVTPADYDDHFLALGADANLDLHFVNGVKISACRKDRQPRRWRISCCVGCRIFVQMQRGAL